MTNGNPQITLTALADPTRQAIIAQLRAGARPVGEIAKALPISRPAVSQHLKVLSQAGLLSVTIRGAQRFYQLEPAGLAQLRIYLDSLWDDALSSFAAHAQDVATRQDDRS